MREATFFEWALMMDLSKSCTLEVDIMAVEPITPREAMERPEEKLPDFVLRAFNNLITKEVQRAPDKRAPDKRAPENRFTYCIRQSDAVEGILEEASKDGVALSRQTVLERGYLKVEDVYWQAGWYVRYEPICYGDYGEPIFIFTKA